MEGLRIQSGDAGPWVSVVVALSVRWLGEAMIPIWCLMIITACAVGFVLMSLVVKDESPLFAAVLMVLAGVVSLIGLILLHAKP